MRYWRLKGVISGQGWVGLGGWVGGGGGGLVWFGAPPTFQTRVVLNRYIIAELSDKVANLWVTSQKKKQSPPPLLGLPTSLKGHSHRHITCNPPVIATQGNHAHPESQVSYKFFGQCVSGELAVRSLQAAALLFTFFCQRKGGGWGYAPTPPGSADGGDSHPNITTATCD